MLTASRRVKMTNTLEGLNEPLATDLCTSKQTLSTFSLAFLNVTFSQALLFRVLQKVSQRHPKILKRNETVSEGPVKYELNSYKHNISCHIQ